MEAGTQAQDYLNWTTAQSRKEALEEIMQLAEVSLKEERTATFYQKQLQDIMETAEEALEEQTIDDLEDVMFAITYAGNCAQELTKHKANLYTEDMDALKMVIEGCSGVVGNSLGIFIRAKLPCFDAAADVLKITTQHMCSCIAIWAATQDEFAGATQGQIMEADPKDESLRKILLDAFGRILES
jgi:hypothetical protein